MDIMENPAVWWLALGLLLLTLEMLTTTLFCFWLSLAAFATAALVWALAPSAFAQAMIFAVAVLACLFGWQKFRPRKLERPRDDMVLNQRTTRYIGREVVLQEAIAQGHGRVNIDDSWWQVRGEDMPAGTRARVEGVEGMVLLIKRFESGAGEA
jgi:membrane protein implicated in regulation of membrane protease activity